MPRVSIIIPLYNVGHDIVRCLRSVCAQTFADLDVVVVDDASTDGSDVLAQGFAAHDARVRVIRHSRNQGLHLSRLTGVRAMDGDYALFLDSDDELCDESVVERLVKEMVDDPADVLRFGLEAVPVQGTSPEEARSLEQWSNVRLGRMTGRGAAQLAFATREGNRLPWHVTHRLFRSGLLRDAFGCMTTNRLQRAEDAYEYFVIASLADSERDACDIFGYRYYLGGGVMSTRNLALDAFMGQAQDIARCMQATEDYASSMGDEHFAALALDLRHKLLETVGNMWHERVREADWSQAIEGLVGLFGHAAVATELWRFVRDRAYELLDGRCAPSVDDELFALLGSTRLTSPVQSLEDPEYERYRSMREIAESHLTDLLGLGSQSSLAIQLEEERMHSALLEERLSGIEGSVSFRIGRVLTAPLRAARDLAPHKKTNE